MVVVLKEEEGRRRIMRRRRRRRRKYCKFARTKGLLGNDGLRPKQDSRFSCLVSITSWLALDQYSYRGRYLYYIARGTAPNSSSQNDKPILTGQVQSIKHD